MGGRRAQRLQFSAADLMPQLLKQGADDHITHGFAIGLVAVTRRCNLIGGSA